MNASRTMFSHVAWLLCLGLLFVLAGCFGGDGGPPAGDDESAATNGGQPSDEPQDEQEQPKDDRSATDEEEAPDDAAAEDAPALSEEDREEFIAEMRDLGVSVEQNDQGHIISLVMGFTDVGDEHLANMPPLPHLEFLGVDHTNITDMGLQAIARRTSLKALYLGGNDITAEGLKHIAGLQNLEYLDLSDLAIGDAAFESLKGLDALQKLNLTATNVTLEGTIAFAKTLPGLEVSAPFGNLIGGRRLTMDPGVEDDDLAELKALESLRELNLWECDQITDTGLEHVLALEQLTTLELGYTQITDAGLAKLATLRHLKRLDLRETKTSIPATFKLVAASTQLRVLADWGTVDGATQVRFEPSVADGQLVHLRHLPQLATLHLWRCDKLTSDGMAHVAKCTNMHVLNLGATNIGDDGVAHLKDLPQLERLILANTPVTDEGAKHIAALSSLQHLDVSSTGIGDEGVAALAGLSNLQALNLARSPVTDAGAAKLSALSNLEYLELQETALTGEFLSDVASELESLQTLDLSLTLVDDAALRHIKNFPSLKSLDLWGTRVTDDGVKHLHDSHLTHLGLFGTAVSREAVAALQEKSPQLEVTLDFRASD